MHVHPTLRCNLACHHCYSESGPARQETLALSVIDRVLADARDLGYDVLSLSGGEPLLYRAMPELVGRARNLGYRVQIVTNGFLVPRAVREGWFEGVTTIAVSIDGYGSRHDTMRRHPGAWTAVLRALDALAERQSSLGLNFTLTPDSIDDLPEVVGLAVERKVDLLQLHVLEAAGRGVLLPHDGATMAHRMRSFAAAALVCAEVRDRLYVQCDLTPGYAVALPPIHSEPLDGDDIARFADLVPVLVLDADGDVRPLSYAMPANWSMGNATQRRMRDIATDFWDDRDGAARLARLWGRMSDMLSLPDAPAVVNVYEALARLARAA